MKILQKKTDDITCHNGNLILEDVNAKTEKYLSPDRGMMFSGFLHPQFYFCKKNKFF